MKERSENQEVVNRYRQLLRVSKWSRKKGDGAQIRKAFELALSAHEGMRRKSGEPYIFHPLAVARIAAEEIGLGTTSIICALLHDVVEDTDTTLDEISEMFGQKVADIIDGLTKIAGVFETNSPQAENYRKMLLTLANDVRVILIKLCDRLHNMRTLEHMSDKGQLKIASETSFLYAPLAHRLGLYAIKTELEDLSLKFVEPVIYQEIKQKLNATKEQRNRYIRSFIKPIKIELDNLGVPFEIKGRSKSIYSILSKMRKKNLPFEDVYDLFAIRITLDSKPDEEKMDCWNVYSIVTSIFKPNPDRMRDWISIPKSNGYESLHATVMGPKGQWVEVQIRTRRMDEVAEKGYAAHWKYKESSEGNSNLDEWVSRIREVLDNQDTNAVDFIDEFKMNLFAEEVFVFTPNGDLRKLPKGATALDFAFEIHTEIGAKCLGAKINGKLVPLSYELRNGDQVEILISGKQKPSKDWLDFVVTSKAKTKIKQSLKDEKRAVASLGKEALERKFRNASLDYNQENINKLVAHFKVPDELELTYLIGKDKIDREKLKLKVILKDDSISGRSGTRSSSGTGFDPNRKKSADEIILGDDTVELEYSFAPCCNPIPGDKVVGFITVGGEIKVHRTNCKNAVNLMSKYGYRIIKAQWSNEVPVLEQFEAAVSITGVDSLGLVGKVTDIVSKELKVNMKSISFESLDGTFVGRLILEVSDTDHLDQLMKELKSIDQHIDVTRVPLKEPEKL